MEKIKRYKSLILSIILLVVTLSCAVSVAFAWYINNIRSTASGINVETDNSNLEIREVINIKRYIGEDLFSNKDYLKYDDGYYYEYDFDNSEYVLSSSQKIPMNIYSIYPNEKIDITIWFRKIGEIQATDYKLCFTDFDDSEGKFYDFGNLAEHSIRGIFRTGEVKDEMDYTWLGTYNGDGIEDTNPSIVIIKNGIFANDVIETYNQKDYYKTTFRIELCLDQYYEKLTAQTNVLSEKKLIIGSIRLFA